MSANAPTYPERKFVRRKGAVLGTPSYHVAAYDQHTHRYILTNGLIVPDDDYELCEGPVVDVTEMLFQKGDGIWYGCNKIATLCCDGSYSIKFNPLRVFKRS